MDSFFTGIHIEFYIFFHAYQIAYCLVISIVEIVTVIASIVLWVAFCLSRRDWKSRISIPGLCDLSQRLQWDLCAVGS